MARDLGVISPKNEQQQGNGCRGNADARVAQPECKQVAGQNCRKVINEVVSYQQSRDKAGSVAEKSRENPRRISLLLNQGAEFQIVHRRDCCFRAGEGARENEHEDEDGNIEPKAS